MDLTYGPEYERFRAEVRAFLAEHWQPSDGPADVAAFRQAAVAAGYLYRGARSDGAQVARHPVARPDAA